ncbi:conserved Plasmodium protein, unknown function [Plasmodium berghei]|uniref:Uncharacterized protein n=2 Tax=Plasmodium berghei TaxID=5821 RepID=A0A509AMK9_PLABA|nr:conserved Plasmodium protein, unknown function [Plasmodium berghei ANKA]SCM24149.1 conserved Plasmodium protein, unknown function [Plasmodium berghei]SCN26950.1 conserved Plasmodium protein, unknown function [Plasmodium berghei]SCO63371.1 conserved Plasmodium protein, unknown function [Plasmodium berghei]VUC56780.1 conserved Plasmodium protein, unknown function [Plasmodium berghei ANKA]|eukprot:XP_034422566.1 conserved Plasmodium protein, unknown function [Plasmodium berghei ANKA]
MNNIKLYQCKYLAEIYVKNKEINEYLSILQYVDSSNLESAKCFKVFIFDEFPNTVSNDIIQENIYDNVIQYRKLENEDASNDQLDSIIPDGKKKYMLNSNIAEKEKYKNYPIDGNNTRNKNDKKYFEIYIFYDEVIDINMIPQMLGMSIYESSFNLEEFERTKNKLIMCKSSGSNTDENNGKGYDSNIDICELKNGKLKNIFKSLNIQTIDSFTGSLIKLPFEVNSEKDEFVEKIRNSTAWFIIYCKNVKIIHMNINHNFNLKWKKYIQYKNISALEGEKFINKDIKYYGIEYSTEIFFSKYIVYDNDIIDNTVYDSMLRIYFLYKEHEELYDKISNIDIYNKLYISEFVFTSVVNLFGNLSIYIKDENNKNILISDICNNRFIPLICNAYIEFLLLLREQNISNRNYNFSSYFPLLDITSKGKINQLIYSIYNEIFDEEKNLKLIFNGKKWMHFSECTFVTNELKNIFEMGILDIMEYSEIMNIVFLEDKIKTAIYYYLNVLSKQIESDNLIKKILGYNLRYIEDIPNDIINNIELFHKNISVKNMLEKNKKCKFLHEIIINNIEHVHFENLLPILVYLVQLEPENVDDLRNIPCFPNQNKKLKKINELIFTVDKEYYKESIDIKCNNEKIQDEYDICNQINRHTISNDNLISIEFMDKIKNEDIEKLRLLGLTIIYEEYKLNDNIHDILLDLDKLFFSTMTYENKITILNKIIYQLEKNIIDLENPAILNDLKNIFFLPIYKSKNYNYIRLDNDAAINNKITKNKESHNYFSCNLKKKDTIKTINNNELNYSNISDLNSNSCNNIKKGNFEIEYDDITSNNTANAENNNSNDIIEKIDDTNITHFIRINEGYDKKYFNVIFLKKKCYCIDNIKVSPKLCELLELKKKPQLNDVINHLEIIINNSANTRFQNISKIYEDIYEYFEHLIFSENKINDKTCNEIKENDKMKTISQKIENKKDIKTEEYERFKNFIKESKFIFIKNKLWKSNNVFFLRNCIPLNLFICELPKLYKIKYPNLMSLSGIQLKLKHSKLVNILNKIRNSFNNNKKNIKSRNNENKINDDNFKEDKSMQLTGLLKMSYINTLNMIDISICDESNIPNFIEIEKLSPMKNSNILYNKKMVSSESLIKPLECKCFEKIYLPNINYVLIKKNECIYIKNSVLYKNSKEKNVIHKDIKENIINLLNIPIKTIEQNTVERTGSVPKIARKKTLKSCYPISNKMNIKSVKDGLKISQTAEKKSSINFSSTTTITRKYSKFNAEKKKGIATTVVTNINKRIMTKSTIVDKKQIKFPLKESKDVVDINTSLKRKFPLTLKNKINNINKVYNKESSIIKSSKKKVENKGNKISEPNLFKDIKNLIYFLDDIGCFDVNFIIDKRIFEENYIPKPFLKMARMYLYIKVKKKIYEDFLFNKEDLIEYAHTHNISNYKEYINAENNNTESFKSCTDLICLYLFENFSSILDSLLVFNNNKFFEWYPKVNEECNNGNEKINGSNFNYQNKFTNTEIQNENNLCIDNMGVNPLGMFPDNVDKLDGNGDIKSTDLSEINKIPNDKEKNKKKLYKKICSFNNKDKEVLKKLFFYNYFQDDKKNEDNNDNLCRPLTVANFKHKESKIKKFNTMHSVLQNNKAIEEINKNTFYKGKTELNFGKMLSINKQNETNNSDYSNIILIRMYKNDTVLSHIKCIEKAFLECKKFNEKFLLFSKNLVKLNFIKIDGKVEQLTSLVLTMSENHFQLREKFYKNRKEVEDSDKNIESKSNGNMVKINDEENFNSTVNKNLEMFLQCQIYSGNKSSRWIIGFLNDVGISICFEHYQLFRKHFLFQNLNVIYTIDNLPMHIKWSSLKNNCNIKKLKNIKNFEVAINSISNLYNNFLKLAHRNAVKKLLKHDTSKILYKHKNKWVKKKKTANFDTTLNVITEENCTNRRANICNDSEFNNVNYDKQNMAFSYIYKINKNDIKNFNEIYKVIKSKYLNFIPKNYDKNDLFSHVIKHVFMNCNELKILPCLKKRDNIYSLYWGNMHDCINIYPFCKYLNSLTFFMLDLGLTILLPYFEIDNIIHLHKMVDEDNNNKSGNKGNASETIDKEFDIKNVNDERKKKNIEDKNNLFLDIKKDQPNISKTTINNDSNQNKNHGKVCNLTPVLLRNAIKKTFSAFKHFIKECLDEKNISTILYLFDYVFSDFKQNNSVNGLVRCVTNISLLVILYCDISYLKGNIHKYVDWEDGEESIYNEVKESDVKSNETKNYEIVSDIVNSDLERFNGMSNKDDDTKSIDYNTNTFHPFFYNNKNFRDTKFTYVNNFVKIKNNNFNSDLFYNFDCINFIKYSENSQIYYSKYFYLFNLNEVTFINADFYSVYSLSLLIDANIIVKLTFDNLTSILNGNIYPHIFHYCNSFNMNEYNKTELLDDSCKENYNLISKDDKHILNMDSDKNNSNNNNDNDLIISQCPNINRIGDIIVNDNGKEKDCLLSLMYNAIKIPYDFKIIAYNKSLLHMIVELYNENEGTIFLNKLKEFRLLITLDSNKSDELDKKYMYVHNICDIKNIIGNKFKDDNIEEILFLLGYRKICNAELLSNTIIGKYLINDYEDLMLSLYKNAKYLKWGILNNNDINVLLNIFLLNIKFNSNNMFYLKSLPIFYSLNHSKFLNILDKNKNYIVINSKNIDLLALIISEIVEYYDINTNSKSHTMSNKIDIINICDYNKDDIRVNYNRVNNIYNDNDNRINSYTVKFNKKYSNDNFSIIDNNCEKDTIHNLIKLDENKKEEQFLHSNLQLTNGVISDYGDTYDDDTDSHKIYNNINNVDNIIDISNENTIYKIKYIFLHHFDININFWKHINIECWNFYNVIKHFFYGILVNSINENLFQNIILYIYKEYEDVVENQYRETYNKNNYVNNIYNAKNLINSEFSYEHYFKDIFCELRELRLKFKSNFQISQLYNKNYDIFKEFINDNRLFKFVHLSNFKYEQEFLENMHFHVMPNITELNDILSILIYVLKNNNNLLDSFDIKIIFNNTHTDCSKYTTNFNEQNLDKKINSILKYTNDNFQILIKNKNDNFVYLLKSLIYKLMNTNKFSEQIKSYTNLYNFYRQNNSSNIQNFIEKETIKINNDISIYYDNDNHNKNNYLDNFKGNEYTAGENHGSDTGNNNGGNNVYPRDGIKCNNNFNESERKNGGPLVLNKQDTWYNKHNKRKTI